MGLLRFIERNLPEHWEKASRNNRCKRDWCRRIYDAIPNYYKGNKLRDKDVGRRAIKYIQIKFERELLYAIDVTNTDIDFWKQVNEEANQIKEQCR